MKMGSSCSSKNSTAVHNPVGEPPVAQPQTNGNVTANNTKKHVEINSNVTEIKQTDTNRIAEVTSHSKEPTKDTPATGEEKKDEEKPVDVSQEAEVEESSPVKESAPVEEEQPSSHPTDPQVKAEDSQNQELTTQEMPQEKDEKAGEPPTEEVAIKQEEQGTAKEESRDEPDGAAVETTMEEEQVETPKEAESVDATSPEETPAPLALVEAESSPAEHSEETTKTEETPAAEEAPESEEVSKSAEENATVEANDENSGDADQPVVEETDAKQTDEEQTEAPSEPPATGEEPTPEAGGE